MGNFYDFKQPTRYITLSNGRVYTDLYEYTNGNIQLVEVSDTGFRKTGIEYTGADAGFDKAGNLYRFNWVRGTTPKWDIFIRKLTGFDGNNNPTYAPESIYKELDASAIRTTDPQNVSSQNITFESDSSIFVYDQYNGNNHSGVIQKNSNYYNYVTQPEVGWAYKPKYPTNGVWPLAGSWYSGGPSDILGDIAFTQYRGEAFLSYTQTNEWEGWYKNGLHLLNFGVVADGSEAQLGSAGNVLWASSFKLNDSTGFIGHQDESLSGRYHLWLLEHLNSVHTDTFDIVKNGTPVITSPCPCTDLLAGLPFQGEILRDTVMNGWTIPASNQLGGFRMFTGLFQQDVNSSPNIDAAGYNVTKTISKVLPTISGNWELTGNLLLPGQVSNGMFTPSNQLHLKIYDINNKVIADIANNNKGWGAYAAPHNFQINDTTVYQDPTLGAFQVFNNFDLKTIGAQLQFTFMGNTVIVPISDNTASISQPARLAIEFTPGDPYGHGQEIVLKDLKFCNLPVYYSLLK